MAGDGFLHVDGEQTSMTLQTAMILTTMILIALAACQFFGWKAIPKFFNYDPAWAVICGVGAVGLLFAPLAAYAIFNHR